MRIHEKIRLIRKLKGWSQEEMAFKLHMSQNGYGSIERGGTDINLSRLEEIAAIFGMSLTELSGFNEKTVFDFHNETALRDENYDVCCNGENEHLPKCLILTIEIEKLKIINAYQEKEILLLKKMLLKNKLSRRKLL